jgi:hypothetical protein
MKIIFTRPEIEEIVLNYIRIQCGLTSFNKVELDSYSYRNDYCVATYVEPKEPEEKE